MTKKCIHAHAQTAARHHRYLLNQNQTDQFIAESVYQNTKNQDFKKDTKA